MSKKLKIPIEVIALEGDGYHLFIKAKIKKKVLRLLIDTGASKTVLDKNFISKNLPNLSLEKNEKNAVSASSNDVETEIAIIKKISVGDLILTNVLVAVMDLAHINATYASINVAEIDGVIGCDFMVDHKAVINLKKNQLRINIPS